jgi:glucoamylase
MTELLYRTGSRLAFGAPGIPPRWQHGDKDGVGTAYSADSKLWYTLWHGIVTEVYYPIIDHPQLRDLQFLVTDGRTFFHEERRHLTATTGMLDSHAPAYGVTLVDPDGRYRLEKEVLAHPHLPVLLERVRVRPGELRPEELRLYLLAAPHLGGGGLDNSGYVAEVAGRPLLLAERDGIWLALGASVPFRQASCGYVGASDGWTDVSQHLRMEWEFDRAPHGNIALTGAIDPRDGAEFTVAVGFGRGPTYAVASVLQALGTPYSQLRARFLAQWHRRVDDPLHEPGLIQDGGLLWRASRTTLHVHEDKSFPGAFIASLAIPWGNSNDDEDRGGYHLVWTRDLCQIASGLLAAGDRESPLRSLIYLAANQHADGTFPQNFWLTGEPFWGSLQLDEIAFPILLAGHLARDGALQEFDPNPMVRAAARALVANGPATGQERWEEASGYSPSTLAAHTAALVVAAGFARARLDAEEARFLEEYADFLEDHIDRWTVTRKGDLVADHPVHYVRILPVRLDDPSPEEDVETALLPLANQPPGAPASVPARRVVDAGFLELVRYGVRSPTDRIVEESVAVVDEVLRVETPFGPTFHRYNGDRYGQRDDGGPFHGWGVGRGWPLLTGERGHYELAAGRDTRPYLRALERFATPTGLLPEQVWDTASLPSAHLSLGRPTGGAMPLAWAHAEYLKLVRSARDRTVFDRVPEVAARYLGPARPPRGRWEVVKPNRCPRSAVEGVRLRFLRPEPFVLHAGWDGWRDPFDLPSHPAPLGFHLVDLEIPRGVERLDLTYRFPERDAWEGCDSTIAVRPRGPAR